MWGRKHDANYWLDQIANLRTLTVTWKQATKTLTFRSPNRIAYSHVATDPDLARHPSVVHEAGEVDQRRMIAIKCGRQPLSGEFSVCGQAVGSTKVAHSRLHHSPSFIVLSGPYHNLEYRSVQQSSAIKTQQILPRHEPQGEGVVNSSGR